MTRRWRGSAALLSALMASGLAGTASPTEAGGPVIPLAVATSGSCDFRLTAVTGDSDLAATAGDVRIEFTHRATLARYSATFANGFKRKETRSLCLRFPDDSGLADLAWFRLFDRSGDEWGVEQVRIDGPNSRPYYELDPSDDDWTVTEWIDGTANWQAPHYANDMIQFLPMVPLDDTAQRARVILKFKDAPPKGPVTLRFRHRNRSAAEAFTLDPAAVDGTSLTLASRLGEYRRLEVSADGDGAVLDNVTIKATGADGQDYLYFTRDTKGDGHDWSAPMGQGAVVLDLVGASYQHRWTARDDAAAGAVIGSYFQGYEIWPNGDGIGAANAAFLETLRAARPGRSDTVNPVSVAIYKARRTHEGQPALYRTIAETAALPHMDVKYIYQRYEDLQAPGVRTFQTDRGILTERPKSMMHNKFVVIRDTADGPTVTTSTANWSTNSQGRWQSSLRVSGFPALWAGYQRYFDNLFKYHPNTPLDEVSKWPVAPAYWGSRPNDGDDFNVRIACNQACEGNGVREYAAKYDTPDEVLGPLRARAWFFPRRSPTETSPLRNEFLALESWLASGDDRRAEIFIMHLSQRDEAIYDVIHRLHADPHADVKVVTSLKGNPEHMHGIATYQGKPRANVTGLDARIAQVKYEVHSKNVLIRKWLANGRRTLPVAAVVLTGSYNMIASTLTDRDENLLRLEYTGGSNRSFEQQVYRPHLDQFMRAWNSYRMTMTVGDPDVAAGIP